MTKRFGGYCLDDHDYCSIIGRAHSLEGKRLADAIEESGLKDLVAKLKGKGAAGQCIQALFGISVADNRAEPDFPSIRDEKGELIAMELKAVPLKLGKTGALVKERTVICNIDYFGLLKESWSKSHARSKLNRILFIFYTYDGEDWRNSVIQKALPWSMDAGSEEIFRSDWQLAWNMVEAGKAHELSESLAKVLATCRRGAGGKSGVISQPRSSVKALKRGFALKPSFTRTHWERLGPKSDDFESLSSAMKRAVPVDFREAVLAQLRMYEGRSVAELIEEQRADYGEPPGGKSKNAVIVRRMLGFKKRNARVLEFEQSGVLLRTPPVRESDFKLLQEVSFPAMKLAEFVNERWEVDSELSDHLDIILFVPIMHKNQRNPKESGRIGRAVFWSPSPEEWEIIRKEWLMYQNEVKHGKWKTHRERRGKKTVNVSGLTKASDTRIIHMRPHGADGDDRDDAPYNIVKQCFWLNGSFVSKILNPVPRSRAL